ncbi:hypothetical protein [Erythrobacter tepidarius]|uniref:hypothetical protein n=1 Tax=Erythrobacter tepidarius TaxID=60454 RepID=UPI000A37634F|nr:hypothetical protein [Erythrobacter tepidarius]
MLQSHAPLGRAGSRQPEGVLHPGSEFDLRSGSAEERASDRLGQAHGILHLRRAAMAKAQFLIGA